MDYNENQGGNYHPESQEPVREPMHQAVDYSYSNRKKVSGWRIFWRIVLVLSVMGNVFLFLLLIGIAAISSMGQTADYYHENTLVDGSPSKKIAVIRLEGIIDGQVSDEVRRQFEAAREDGNIKAVIIRAMTPGGTVSASDQIHHEITKFKEETGKPVVSFMQGVAASGGYYVSVACDRIVSEPTCITGSIGVIGNYMVLKELLEEKLGISPVVIKSGEKKDWPSMFTETTEEQKQYLMEKLIGPAYERFVKLVNEGRDNLNIEQVRALSDGGIYGAEEAVTNGLIDEIGYFEEAITAAEVLAGIKGCRAVEYQRPFSLPMLFSASSKSMIGLDKNAIEKFVTPQLLYLWDMSW